MHRFELKIAHGVKKAWHSTPVQVAIELAPGMIHVVAQMLPVEKHMTLVSVQVARIPFSDNSRPLYRYSSPETVSRAAMN